MAGLILAFFGTALLYAAVGFGGGSTYNALLVLAGTDYRAIPSIALVCNMLVVSVGSWRFAAAGHVQWRRIWPLFTLSVPMAWLGGRIVIAEITFVGLLALALFTAGATMLWQREPAQAAEPTPGATWAEPLIGGALGFLAGLVGIGGGIFLAPILHLLRWGGAKAIAGTCAVFILVNSVAGLAGQLAKADAFDRIDALGAHWLLFPAVLAGGAIGSSLGSGRLRASHVRIATALLVLYVAARLGLRFHNLQSGSAS
ncbi:MAG: sulfite exporter TauE/SafE family protein [Pseudomonadota bacterium]|nr:sulfite exporter TauE/SafE family protein [Pseudomonadota bacterium]